MTRDELFDLIEGDDVVATKEKPHKHDLTLNTVIYKSGDKLLAIDYLTSYNDGIQDYSITDPYEVEAVQITTYRSKK